MTEDSKSFLSTGVINSTSQPRDKQEDKVIIIG